MKCRLEKLLLKCKQEEVEIVFSPEINFFWGQISAGKSSIVRLIDYCLGGKLEKTPAISSELISVELYATMGENKVILQREAFDSNKIQVTWIGFDGETRRILAPLQSSRRGEPIYGENIYTISDLLLSFFGITPFRVHISKRVDKPILATLSFRDIMWYCYLKQEYLDSSFFRLERPPHMIKSRYAFMFIIGLYSDKLNKLETDLSNIRKEIFDERKILDNIIKFLEPFGFDNVYEIDIEINKIKSNLLETKYKLDSMRSEYISETSFVDELRTDIKSLDDKIYEQEIICEDIKNMINEQEELKNELFMSQHKIDRLEYAKNVLDDIPFIYCPACGMKLKNKNNLKNVCYLCGQEHREEAEAISLDKEVIKRDIYNRINELDESIERHNKSLIIQKVILKNLKNEKNSLDDRLDTTVKQYDSRYLTNTRIIERDIARFEEKLRNLNRIKELPLAVSNNERYINELKFNENEIKKQIDIEKENLKEAENRLEELENKFLESLLIVKVPGVSENDKIKINTKTWMPEVYPMSRETSMWNFNNAGSAGKKTLFNVCYALSLHNIAREYELPLPTLLIIDTPMKNIGEDVNRDIFEAFYEYLYELAEGTLKGTQFIIIDKEYFPPESKIIEVIERYMTPNEEENPPLIPYYRGP